MPCFTMWRRAASHILLRATSCKDTRWRGGLHEMTYRDQQFVADRQTVAVATDTEYLSYRYYEFVGYFLFLCYIDEGFLASYDFCLRRSSSNSRALQIAS